MEKFDKQDIKNILKFLEAVGSLNEFCDWSKEPNFNYLIEKVVQRERLNEETIEHFCGL